MIKALLVVLSLLLASAVTLSQSRVNLTLPNPNPFDEMLPVNFCEVIKNAHRYDGKIIRVRAILWRHFEGAALLPYDSGYCGGMRVVWDCEADDCRQLDQRLLESLGGKTMGRAALLVVGRFKYRKIVTGNQLRMGIRPYELQISKVEEVLKLPERSN